MLPHSFTKKTLDSWACLEWLYFKVFHRGYNRTVSTPIRHQNKSRDLRSQFFSLSHHMLVQSSNLPLDPKPVLGQRNEETKKLVTLHLINLRREEPALASLLPGAKCVNS